MPGIVLSLKVKLGQQISQGDGLVVLSAMKMETLVASPISGTVKALHVAEGNTLSAGDLLMEIDA
jgi:pyruvate carboxylase